MLFFQRKLYVTSQWEVSQVPLDMCEVYSGGCHGCLMSRDPYCGWDQDRCVSIYSSQRYIGPKGRQTSEWDALKGYWRIILGSHEERWETRLQPLSC